MNTYIKLLIVISTVVGIVSCKNEKDPVPSESNQSLTLRITPKVGNDTLDFSEQYVTENNERYTLSSFRYYMSNVRLIKNDGSEHKLEGKVFLVNPNTSDYSLGNVPVGEYKGIRFSVGLDNVTNHLDPTTYTLSNPLAIQSPAIHWSWNSGYIFLMLEGTCDTTAMNDDVLTYGQYSHSLFYHIGMDDLLRDVEVSNTAFTVSQSNTKVLHMHSDINKLFVGVDMKTQNASHTMGSMPLATIIADNIADMFTIEE